VTDESPKILKDPHSPIMRVFAVALSKAVSLCGTCVFNEVMHHPPVGIRPGRSSSIEILAALHSETPTVRSASPVPSHSEVSSLGYMCHLRFGETIMKIDVDYIQVASTLPILL